MTRCKRTSCPHTRNLSRAHREASAIAQWNRRECHTASVCSVTSCFRAYLGACCACASQRRSESSPAVAAAALNRQLWLVRQRSRVRLAPPPQPLVGAWAPPDKRRVAARKWHRSAAQLVRCSRAVARHPRVEPSPWAVAELLPRQAAPAVRPSPEWREQLASRGWAERARPVVPATSTQAAAHLASLRTAP